MSFRIADLSMTNILVVPWRRNSYAPNECFYCLSLKAIEFNGVDTTGLLRNLVVLAYLFILIDILKSYLKTKKSHTVKNLLGDRKVITEKLFFNGFDTFLAQFFFDLAVFAFFKIFRQA